MAFFKNNPRADGLFNNVLRFIPFRPVKNASLSWNLMMFPRFYVVFPHKKKHRFPIVLFLSFHCYSGIAWVYVILIASGLGGNFWYFTQKQIVQCLGWQYSMTLYIFGFVSQGYFLLANHHYNILFRLLKHTTWGKCCLKNMVSKVSKSKCMLDETWMSLVTNDPSV